jgi:integrase
VIHVTAVHNFNNYKSKSGKYPISLRIYCNGEKRYINLGFKVESKYWSNKQERVKDSHPLAGQINQLINIKRLAVESQALEWQSRNKLISIDLILDFLSVHNKMGSFNEYIDEYMRGPWGFKPNTRKKYVTFQKYFREFAPHISLSQLLTQTPDDFARWLVEQKDVSGTTALKYVKVLIAVVNDATRKGVFPEYPFKYSKISVKASKPQEKAFLTFDEVTRIENLNIKNNPRLEDTRRKFLFCLYTGIYYSDLKNLPWSWVKEGSHGSVLIGERYKEMNGKRPIYIVPLFSKTAEILKDQKDEDPELIFPNCISDQKYNKSLKDLAEVAKINKNITNKTARDSFVQYLTGKGIPEAIVRKMVGHTDDRSLKHYYSLQETEIIDMLNQKGISIF